MNQFLPAQFQLNNRSFIKIGVTSLALSLSVGAGNSAYAQPVPQIEVLSVPPQEAFLMEDKASVMTPEQDAQSEVEGEDDDEDPLYDRSTIAYVADDLERQQPYDLPYDLSYALPYDLK
ncbi:MAG: hypothetical protein SAK29_23460 [Scytonema sp. PMC 1069.18]|nr:hypothetical protein [Scytonema sp. PMC 1069.18]MEC4885789.1 hypothetical protein [Scytonema sp. PMC 1070.18]